MAALGAVQQADKRVFQLMVFLERQAGRRVQQALDGVEILVADERFMQTARLDVVIDIAARFGQHAAAHGGLRGLAAPCHIARVQAVAQHVAHRLSAPCDTSRSALAPCIETAGNDIAADTLQAQIKDLAHDRCLRRVWFERVALAALHLDAEIAVGVGLAHVFALFDRRDAPGDHAALDGLILAARHEQAKLEVFLVELVGGVVSLCRGDDACARVFERLCDDALVNAVAAGKTLDLHNQHAVPMPGLDLGQQPLHLRPRGDGFARDDLLVDAADLQPHAAREREQRGAVPGEGFALATGFGLGVRAGFA